MEVTVHTRRRRPLHGIPIYLAAPPARLRDLEPTTNDDRMVLAGADYWVALYDDQSGNLVAGYDVGMLGERKATANFRRCPSTK